MTLSSGSLFAKAEKVVIMKKLIGLTAGFSLAAICVALAVSCQGASSEKKSSEEPALASLKVNNRNIEIGNSSPDLNKAPLKPLDISNDEALFGIDIVLDATQDKVVAKYGKMTPGLTTVEWISSGKLTFMNGDTLAIQVSVDGKVQYYRFNVKVAPPNVQYTKDFHAWALTPPMGWNSYDCYGCNVTEAQVKENALYMAQNLRQYGYEYIIVDGRWFAKNQTSGYLINTNNDPNGDDPGLVLDEWGRHTPAENRFPSAANGAGFTPLADYVHSLGLKFGIHIMRGIPVKAVQENLPVLGANGITANQIHSTQNQCNWLRDNYTIDASKSGAQEYYDSIFELYAEWGVDYVKVDDISQPYRQNEINMVRKAIEKTGRVIVLSLSPGSTPIANAAHVKENANLWRMTDDVWDRWGDIVHLLDTVKPWFPDHVGAGYWPDADMMPFGKINKTSHAGGDVNRFPRITQDEQYTLMTLFAIMRSPLMFGGNMPDNDEFTTNLIANEEVLYITKRSKNNREVYANGDRSILVWTADDSRNGDKFLALFFCGATRPGHAQLGNGYTPRTEEIPFDLSLLGFTAAKVNIRDLWQKEDIGEFVIAGEQFKPVLQFHGAGLYRLSPSQ
jgi:hypothetical protein